MNTSRTRSGAPRRSARSVAALTTAALALTIGLGACGRDEAGGGAEGLPVLSTGYRSGLSVSMRADRPVRDWDGLRHRTLCTSADNTRAQALAARLNARLQVHAAPAQALVRVRTGDCDAAVLDHAQLAPLLAQKEWTKFAAPLRPTEASALQVWLAPSRRALAAPLRAAMAELDDPLRWAQRRQTWASNVAFEVYYDQTGPDCHWGGTAAPAAGGRAAHLLMRLPSFGR